jgi:hypothetical protein
MNISERSPKDEAQLLAVGPSLRDHTARTIVALYGATDPDYGELVGTGVFVEINDTVFILTADHVVTALQGYPTGAFSNGSDSPHPIQTPFLRCIDPNLDLAILPLPPGSIIRANIIPLNLSDFADQSGLKEREIIFIHGYPEKESRFSALAKGVYSESLPYSTFEGLATWPHFNPNLHFALEYNQSEAQRNEMGADAWLKDPPGLSGSGVWRTYQDVSSGWDVRKSKFMGIIHRWDTEGRSLIGTRVEAIHGFLEPLKLSKIQWPSD